jgi:hypothetical protein
MRRTISILSLAITAVAATACATSGAAPSSSSASPRSNSNLISRAEIDGLPNVGSAYDVVLRLRPTWLSKAQSSAITMSGTQVGGAMGGSAGTLAVFVDNARMGDFAALKDIAASTVGTIQFMDASTASAVLPGLGSAVIAGAIVVRSRSGRN